MHFLFKIEDKKLEKFLQRNWVDYGHTHHSWIRNGLAGVLPPALVFQVHLAHLVGQLAGHVVPGHLVPGQGGLLDPGALVWQGGGGHPVRTTSSGGLSPSSVNLNMLCQQYKVDYHFREKINQFFLLLIHFVLVKSDGDISHP